MTTTQTQLNKHVALYGELVESFLYNELDSVANRDKISSIRGASREEFISHVKKHLIDKWLQKNNVTPSSIDTSTEEHNEPPYQSAVTFDYQLTVAQAYAGNVALHNRSFILEPSMIANDLQRCVLHIHRDKQGQVNVYSTMAATSSDEDIKLAKQELKVMVGKIDEDPTGEVDISVDTVLRSSDVCMSGSAFIGQYWLKLNAGSSTEVGSILLLDAAPWGSKTDLGHLVTGLYKVVAEHGTDPCLYRAKLLTELDPSHTLRPIVCYLKNDPNYVYAILETAKNDSTLLSKVTYQTPRTPPVNIVKEEMATTVKQPTIVNAPPQIRMLGTQDVNRSGNYCEINDTAIDKDVPLIKVEQLTDRDDYGQHTPLYWSPSDLVELVKSKLLTHHKASLQTLLDSAMSSYLELFDNRKVGVMMRRYNLTQGLRLTFQNLQPRAMGEIIGLKATVEVIAFVPEFERSEDLQDGRGVALSVTQSVIL